MNRATLSPLPPADDLDQLLGAFFRAEMPHPWPAFLPSPSRTAPPPMPCVRPALPLFGVGDYRPSAVLEPSSRPLRGSRLSGRLALAAAVLCLVGGVWGLGGLAVPDGATTPAVGPGSASPPELPIPLPESSREGPGKSLISLEQVDDGPDLFGEEFPTQR